MSDKSFATVFVAFVLYVLGFVFTFGHAYNKTPDIERQTFGGIEYTVHNGPGTKTAGAMVASMFWPLYWSAQAWK